MKKVTLGNPRTKLLGAWQDIKGCRAKNTCSEEESLWLVKCFAGAKIPEKKDDYVKKGT
ncbi:MAG TPA: hypothetical protein VNZ49_05950 [Bacteroidia bacterium]|nr:hypothetical protein [Bacteroidia bacterium]